VTERVRVLPPPESPSVEEPSARAAGSAPSPTKPVTTMRPIVSGMKNQVRPTHLRRLAALLFLFTMAFLALGARLVDLQVFQHKKYSELAAKNTQRIFLEEPRRGDILDAGGNPLAMSLPVKKVCADPYFVGPFSTEIANAIAPILKYNPDDLAERIQPCGVANAEGKLVPRRYVDLKRKIRYEDWRRLVETMKHLELLPHEERLPRTQRRFFANLRKSAIFAADDQQRIYPSGQLASHVIGFTQVIESNFNHATVTEISGQSGIERLFNEQLAGTRGWRITEIDRRRRELVVYREQNVEPRPGLNVVLTLDMVVQQIVENELTDAMDTFTPASASAVVVRPRSGEILAMASFPNFDPNDLNNTPIDHLRNRVISDQMEPGSTYKTVVIAAGLNEHLIQLTDPIDCESGIWYYKGRPLKDTHAHGVMTVEEVLTKSSNIGAAKIGLILGEQKLYNYSRAFGFGTKTGITLEGEIAGKVKDLDTWDGLTITRMPMGQSVAVTHLQMVMAISAIANDGWLMRPMIVKRLVGADGEVFVNYPPQPVRQVVSERAARQTVAAMKTVVSTEGTARKAVMDHYTVAGKTGTAQIPIPGGYMRSKNIHSFIGFFPADSPEVCISVVINQPSVGRYASQTAVPTFRNIAEQVARYLKIRPDRNDPDEETTGNPFSASGLAAVRPTRP
jgi:cell division protein FtsI (penicillin-binding protein 3)